MKKFLIGIIVLLAAAGIGIYSYWEYQREQALRYPKFYCGNGRLEATEVYVSSKIAGRIDQIFVKEGDLVYKGDKLVQMSLSTLNPNKAETEALIKVAEGELEMAKATVKRKESAFEGAEKEYRRQAKLVKSSASSIKEFEKTETAYKTAKADLEYSRANVISAQGKLDAKKAQLERIKADINDSLLVAAYDGRIQYLLAHEGEVLSAGGRAMNLVNLTDAYMTFFLPTRIAGQVRLGAEVKLVFDAVPEYPIYAKVSFVDPVAQFTPKSVETKVEREKLMFRVKANINADMLRKYIADVKTGLPGVAWVKLDPNASWSEAPVAVNREFEAAAAAVEAEKKQKKSEQK